MRLLGTDPAVPSTSIPCFDMRINSITLSILALCFCMARKSSEASTIVLAKATDRLFAGITGEQVSVAFARACRKADIEDFRLHDLRHTAASWLRMAGADIHTVAQILGHKDLRMAARYQHLSPAFLAEAVGRLDGVFGDLCYQGVTGQKALPEPEPVSA